MNFTAVTLRYCLCVLAPVLTLQSQANESAEASAAASVAQKWARSCALCHVDGNAGAPRIGHAEDWRARLAKGRPTLLRHTIEGYNAMPPLGYCMDCEREDFIGLIELMTGNIAIEAEAPRQ